MLYIECCTYVLNSGPTDSEGRGGQTEILPACPNLSQFSENFWKFLKYIATFGDDLEYSEIPTKIGEFFDEKQLILMKILQIFAKSRKIAEI